MLPSSPQPADPRVQGRPQARLLAALGVTAGCLMVWGSLAALNHWVLGFHAWPQTSVPTAQRLIVPDARHRAGTDTGGGRVPLVAASGGLVAGSAPVTFSAAERVALLRTTTRHRASHRTPAGDVGSPGGAVAPGTGGTVAGGAADPDGDGISTAAEQRLGTNPYNADTDNDGIPDAWELNHGLNPRKFSDGAKDSDGDGVPNRIEFRMSTDPQRTASEDGVPDGSRDSNNDGVSDAVTIEQGGDPTAAPDPVTEPAPTPVTSEPAPAEPVQPPADPAPADPATPAPATPDPAAPTDQPAPTPATQPDPAATPAPETTPPSADPPATDPAPADPSGGTEAPDETALAETAPAAP